MCSVCSAWNRAAGDGPAPRVVSAQGDPQSDGRRVWFRTSSQFCRSQVPGVEIPAQNVVTTFRRATPAFWRTRLPKGVGSQPRVGMWCVSPHSFITTFISSPHSSSPHSSSPHSTGHAWPANPWSSRTRHIQPHSSLQRRPGPIGMWYASGRFSPHENCPLLSRQLALHHRPDGRIISRTRVISC